MGSMLLSVVERCPLYRRLLLKRNDIMDENICPLFGGVRFKEVSVKVNFTVFAFSIYDLALIM